ncbi:MAG TPA: PQQ-binding-like beta-propeller repeat protein [Polyangiaceae bacterium]|nr:PQQ-binding-like beta-propeller repeat protein [Polyangiaceae bacterium]
MTRSRFNFALALVCLAGCGSDSPDVNQNNEQHLAFGELSPDGPKGWPMAMYDLAASGHNAREHILRPTNVDRLEVEWVFDTAAAGGQPVRPIHATPVVDPFGNAYVGDFAGTFFAVSAGGALRWSFTADPPTTELGALFPAELGPPAASPFIGGAALAKALPYVIVGDANGRIYARHRDAGAEIWTARGLNTNPLGGVAGNSLAIVDDTVLVGMSSLENFAFVLTSVGVPVQCCSHRGSVVALDLATGQERWRYNVVDEAAPLPPSAAPFTLGPAGGDIWSQPSYDPASDTVYVSTGQNLSPTASGGSTPTSDAIIALDFTTGAPKWVHQFTENDIWAVGVPNPNPTTGQVIDMDLGDSPKLYTLPGGRKVVGAGQKDGRYHVLDAQTGELVSSTLHLPPRSDLGGFQTGGAVADGVAFQHGLGATDGFSTCTEGMCPYEGFEGRVLALSGDGAEVRWSISIPGSPLVGGLAVANRVVYFQSPVEETAPLTDPPQWGLYAINAETGAVLERLTFSGRAIGSPVVADGHVYVTSGNAALPAYGLETGGALRRLGLPACD